MMKKLVFIWLFVALIVNTSYGQAEVWQAVDKQEIAGAYQNACTWMINTSSYFFKVKYSSYSDYVTKIPVESTEGYYKRVSNSFRMEAMGIKTLQNSKVKFVIDTANKSVTAMSPSSYSMSVASSEELNTMLDYFKTLRKKKVSKTSVCYRIDFNENGLYEAYEFTVSSKGLLEGLTFYYSKQDANADDRPNESKNVNKVIKPRLEVIFYDYQVPAKYSKSEFEEPQIIVSENGKIDLKGDYKNYRLLDYRLKK